MSQCWPIWGKNPRSLHSKLSLYSQTALLWTSTVSFSRLSALKEDQCEHRLHGFLHMFLQCALSLVCVYLGVCARAHSDRIALFRIFPPDCPNKPEQTGRRHCGDVTHSSEPWRLSAWRRSGGLHGDVKQESAHSGTPPFTCVARGSLRTNRLRSFCRSFITLKQRDEITAPRTCRAAAVSRSYKGVRTQTSCSIPWNDRHSLRYYFKKMHAFYYMCRNSGDHRVSENRYECIMHQTHFFSLSAIVVQIMQKIWNKKSW